MTRILVLYSILHIGGVAMALQKDSLVCEKDFTDINTWNYDISLRRQITGTFPIKQGDSIRYAVFREKPRKADFSVYDHTGKEILKTAFTTNVVAGKVEPAVEGNYYFKIKSKRLLPNSFIVTMRKKNCAYVERTIPPKPAIPLYTTDTTITVKVDSSVYLACRLDLKNKQRITIPVDSLQGAVIYEIKSPAGPVKYRFMNSQQKEVKHGEGKLNKGELKGEQYHYNLLLENDDKVVGKHVYIHIQQILLSRRLLENK